MIVLGLVSYYFVEGYNLPNYSFSVRLTHFIYGLAIAFGLLPVQEYIHVLAYKSHGAKNSSYDANLKKLYFMALADKFVSNKKEVEVVALSPLSIATLILILFQYFVNSEWTLTVASVMLAHTAMYSGDFGLLSYFKLNKEKQVVTYDDNENKISYFYGRKDQRNTT